MSISSSLHARDATLAERFFLGLHAMVPAALLAISLAQLFPPARWGALAQRPSWTLWGAVVLWLVFGLLPALLLRRPLMLWRTALVSTALLLMATASAGIALSSAQASPFALVLGALGVASLALATSLGPHRVREHRPGRGLASKAVLARSRPLWRRLRASLPFWVAGGLMVEGFRLAHMSAGEPHRDSGMVAMLAAFFLLLPAATLASWLRRTAVVLAIAAAAVFAWLVLRSGLAQWGLGAVLSLGAALQMGWGAPHKSLNEGR